MKFGSVCGLILCCAMTVMAGEKEEEGFVSLFDGKTLANWKASENKETWSVQDGALVCKGPRSHLFYMGDLAPFKNFELKVDVLTKPGSNAGVYFHTKYQEVGWPKFGLEAQVNNTGGDPKRTASLYGVVNVSEAPAKDNEWFTMEIKVVGKHIVISVDGKEQVNYTQPDDAKPFSNEFTRLLDSGTFCLQGHDPKSEVHFKNIRVKKLPE